MSDIKLNLGCGNDILEGWENYDLYPVNSKVKPIDLNKLPLPFKSNFADYILMSSVYEHLGINRLDLMRDIFRILKPGGIIEIHVPGYHACVDHTLWFFPENYFNGICTDSDSFNRVEHDFCFEKVSLERVYSYKSLLTRLYTVFPIMGKMFPFMCNSKMIWKMRKPLDRCKLIKFGDTR